ncbi:alpha/beta-hydrolase [Lentithecium fluviatile CBS 122367]|uniref:Alpha/beta-hydrolase n=1 Tax=Lentithecium fluviatile CBS 122367 TaxID=1168545 RepID=A0A6G1JFS0_9PLEO|nr:alpha/beta-hydrolase [Lentithecium fluviatile CBS 122367]
MTYPPPYVFEPAKGETHTHTIILLHGRSSTAEDFARDLFSLNTSRITRNLPFHFPTWKWVFPDAGTRWCTPFKEERSAWFDTFSLDDLRERQDLQVDGLREGIRLVQKIIEEEVGILGGNAEKVILGGFSQGSATALWSLFTGAAMMKGNLGAFVGLSAWMPFAKEAKEVVERPTSSSTMKAENLGNVFADIIGIVPLVSARAMQTCLQIPVYLGHGTDDALISVKNCHELSSIFAAIGAKTETREYVGADREGHWIKAPEQVDDIVGFLTRIFGEARDKGAE